MTEPTDRAPSASPEGAPPLVLAETWTDECPAVQPVDEQGHEENHVLVCQRLKGHAGLHYDKGDNISWMVGEPGDRPPAIELTEDTLPEPGGATSAWEHHHGL
jgi:hypothetical protein